MELRRVLRQTTKTIVKSGTFQILNIVNVPVRDGSVGMKGC
jgi:hypothetical protein